jgi:hypothetical protein
MTSSKLNYVIVIQFLFLLTGCSTSNYKNSLNNHNPELVMSPGMVISQENQLGKFIIEAINETTRKYSWDNHNEVFELIPRESRWNGNKGIYRPYWNEIGSEENHAILEEGQQHFCDRNEMLDYLRRQGGYYTSDGLLVHWEIKHNNSAPVLVLIVDITQVYLNGKKPKNLEGSRNDKISIFIPPNIIEPKVGNFTPSCAQQIDGNGRWYSGRSIDTLLENGLSLSYIENSIKNTTPVTNGDKLCYKGKENIVNKAFTACTDMAGNVVSISPYAF